MNGGAWKAAVHGVTKSRRQRSDFHFTDTLLLELETLRGGGLGAGGMVGEGGWAALYLII